jgi:ABC-2 type transport system permease protein
MNAVLNTTIALMKRELWEHRSIWLVPASFAGVLLVFYLWGMLWVMPSEIGLELFVERLADSRPDALKKVSSLFVPGAAVPFTIVMSFIIVFYLLDSLYSERRDRSILFWKSLPVTDNATVMSKWLTVFITIPLCTLAVVAVVSLFITLVTGIVVIIGGGNAWTLVWSNYGFFSGLFNVAGLITVELLWFLPLLGWLMLASAWAKKAPFLWATLPPLAVIILEEMFLDSNEFLYLLGSRLVPFGDSEHFDNAVAMEGSGFETNTRLFGNDVFLDGSLGGVSWSMFTDLLVTQAFWGGALFAAACTAGAIWLRRYRDES